jgi:hypothetical protein
MPALPSGGAEAKLDALMLVVGAPRFELGTPSIRNLGNAPLKARSSSAAIFGRGDFERARLESLTAHRR